MAMKDDRMVNRLASPMEIMEERFDIRKSEMEKKRQQMIASQQERCSFLIGSVEEAGARFSDQRLGNIVSRELVVDRSFSARSPAPLLENNSEYNSLTGYFSRKDKNAKRTEDSNKPRLVELHQFPGYDESEVTPLPHGVSVVTTLKKVTRSQAKLRKRSTYLTYFERQFYSPLSQTVIQDIFWWFFLEKYHHQSSGSLRRKLFNRVAHNYTQFLASFDGTHYRDTFFKDYPSVVAQAVYCCFCECFPDSHVQFGEDFKEDLVNLVFDWIAGARPQSRCWWKWNMSALEPENTTTRAQLRQQETFASKPSPWTTFVKSRPEVTQTLEHQPIGKTLPRKSTVKKATLVDRFRTQKVLGRQDSRLTNSTSVTDTTQEKRTVLPDLKTVSEEVAPHLLSSVKDQETKTSDRITTERTRNKPGQIPDRRLRKNTGKESHTVGRGPDFVKEVFNIYGQSPLVAHFLRMKRLDREAGVDFKVRRTQMHNLPAVNTPTYRDLIRDSYKQLHNKEEDYKAFLTREQEKKKRLVLRLKEDLREHKQHGAALLSRPNEVKQISDLLVLDMKKDQDSITARPDAAIEAALHAPQSFLR